jgi:hypothetical protein
LSGAGRGEFALRVRCVLLGSPLGATAAPRGLAAPFGPFLRAFFAATLGLFLATLAVFETSGALLLACLLAPLLRIRRSGRCGHRSWWNRNGRRRWRRWRSHGWGAQLLGDYRRLLGAHARGGICPGRRTRAQAGSFFLGLVLAAALDQADRKQKDQNRHDQPCN